MGSAAKRRKPDLTTDSDSGREKVSSPAASAAAGSRSASHDSPTASEQRSLESAVETPSGKTTERVSASRTTPKRNPRPVQKLWHDPSYLGPQFAHSSPARSASRRAAASAGLLSLSQEPTIETSQKKSRSRTTPLASEEASTVSTKRATPQRAAKPDKAEGEDVSVTSSRRTTPRRVAQRDYHENDSVASSVSSKRTPSRRASRPSAVRDPVGVVATPDKRLTRSAAAATPGASGTKKVRAVGRLKVDQDDNDDDHDDESIGTPTVRRISTRRMSQTGGPAASPAVDLLEGSSRKRIRSLQQINEEEEEEDDEEDNAQDDEKNVVEKVLLRSARKSKRTKP
jgi:hypothetical protein